MIIITLAITNSNQVIVQSFLGYIELLNLVNYAIWYSSSCIYFMNMAGPPEVDNRNYKVWTT